PRARQPRAREPRTEQPQRARLSRRTRQPAPRTRRTARRGWTSSRRRQPIEGLPGEQEVWSRPRARRADRSHRQGVRVRVRRDRLRRRRDLPPLLLRRRIPRLRRLPVAPGLARVDAGVRAAVLRRRGPALLELQLLLHGP